jgi:hypothetical protein
MPRLAAICLALAAAAFLQACSPTFGGSPSREVIVVPAGTPLPPGARIVCSDGRAPPC